MNGSLEFFGIIALIIISWPIVLTVMKRIGGWGVFEERYAKENIPDGEKLRFNSISFRKGKGVPFNYGGVTTITVSDKGMGVNTFFPFTVSHKPFFIPWSDVTSAARTKIVITNGTGLQVKGADRTLIIWDFAGQKILQECTKRGIAVSPG